MSLPDISMPDSHAHVNQHTFAYWVLEDLCENLETVKEGVSLCLTSVRSGGKERPAYLGNGRGSCTQRSPAQGQYGGLRRPL